MPVVIVGAGLAGLIAALKLQAAGIEFQTIEADTAVGGRLQTDIVEGFRLDRGFQVAFTEYPAMQEWLEIKKLEYRAFEPGALLWDGSRVHEVHNRKPLQMALSSYLSFADKLKILSLRSELQSRSIAELFAAPDLTAEQYLRKRGFSDAFLDRFARPFFGGIFLDRSLQVSSRMFSFVWKMLSQGETVIPRFGIGSISNQLAEKIAPERMRLGCRVESVVEKESDVEITLATGEVLTAEQVIIATEADTAAKLLHRSDDFNYVSSTCIYFELSQQPTSRPILILNASGRGRVNEFVPVSNVVPDCAPAGRHLASVTLLELSTESDEALFAMVKEELALWFPQLDLSTAKHLKTYRIAKAQLKYPVGLDARRPNMESGASRVFWSGEVLHHGSIQGAMQSGAETAEAVMRRMQNG